MTTTADVDTAINTEIQTLKSLLPKLAASDREFAIDLIQSYGKYGKLTKNQMPWIGKLIVRANQTAVEPKEISVGGFAEVVALFTKAKEHLKWPKVVLKCADHTIVLAMAGAKSKAPGSINVMGEGTYPTRAWYGRVTPAGTWIPSNSMTIEFQQSLQTLLSEFGANPARVAKKYGQLTGHCCFCASQLTDPRSTAVGYGPTCAKHYGLVEEWKKAAATFDEFGVPLQSIAKISDSVKNLQYAIAKTGFDFEKIATEFDNIEAATAMKALKPDVVEGLVGDWNTKLCFLCEKNEWDVVKNDMRICKPCADELEM